MFIMENMVTRKVTEMNSDLWSMPRGAVNMYWEFAYANPKHDSPFFVYTRSWLITKGRHVSAFTLSEDFEKRLW